MPDSTAQIDRRTFVTATVSIAATPVLAGATYKEQTLVDTHLHCFAGAKDSRFPYHKRAPYRPDVAATPEHLLNCMNGAGVSHAVVVHPEPYQDDHRYLEHCLKAGKGKLKGTILLFADRPGSIEKLPQLVKRMPVFAARVHAYAPDRLPPFGKPELKALWKLASDHNLAMQLHFEPRYASGFEPLIREFRNTRVIIDHLGRPLQGTPKEHAVVVKWSRFPNTIMKVSSLKSTRNYPHRDIAPIIRTLTDAYGPDRMIYGGGFSATASPKSYRDAFRVAEGYLQHLSAGDRRKILGGTAKRLFFS